PRTMHCAPRCYLLKWTVLPDPGEGWGGFAGERMDTRDPWKVLHGYVKREGVGMPNLERIQRIAGSLGKHAGEVRFGPYGPTLEEVGKLIGTQPAMLTE
ncbi:hypothetical protein LCGC14_1849730, partial [marine sediment metagenome]